MTKKIFHSILLVAGTVLLASLLVIMGCLYEYFGSVEKKQLRDELELAAVAVEKNGTEYLSQLSSERYRLTWIENDGTVLYDTVTDAESLENHADRVEVKQALEYGEGESTRYSSTLLQKTMYCAEKLTDGSVLRISMSRATAGVLLVGMVQPILVVLIVALILSSVLAKSLSRRIVQPLNKLDLEHPLENDAYEELAPLLGLADGIVDIVETGTTLKENGLEVAETIAGISARLIANTASLKMRKQEIEALAARMEAQIEKNREEKSV